MGFSSFWTAIKRPRFSDSSESRKQVDRVYDHHHTAAPVREAGNEPPHHFDSIYNTHHHILPSKSNDSSRHPPSPPRIHSPTLSKQNNKPSLWKTASVRIKPSQRSDALKAEKSMKRRSFWSLEPKATTTAPPVRKPEPIICEADDRKAKRNSFWRSQEPEDDRLIPSNDTNATNIKTKRSNRRLSLHRNASSKSRNSLRFSFLAGGAVDTDDDEDIPAMPAIPVDIKRQKSKSMDPGRQLAVGGVQPGTAITSDDLYNTASPNNKRDSTMKRRSLSRLITSRKSASDLQEDNTISSNKRKRRSWFSTNGSDSSPNDTAIPPIPSVPKDISNLPFPHNLAPDEAAFHRFLLNIHNAAPQTSKATDFDRFLDASRAYDDSIPAPTHLSHRNSASDLRAPGAVSTAPTALKRSTIAAPQQTRSRSRASRCRPQKPNTAAIQDVTTSPTGPSFLSTEQQHEWSKLRELMDDSGSGSGSGSGSNHDSHGSNDRYGNDYNDDDDDDDDEEDDGVMGMLRQLSRDEARETKAQAKEAKRLRDRERYLGVGGAGKFQNKDALARLECGSGR